MNIVQIGDKLRDLPISILRSGDIVLILNKVNALVPEDSQITAQSTGNDLYKLFNSVNGDIQSVLLEEIFNARKEALILGIIMEEAGKQSRKDVTTTKKWTTLQGSIMILCAAALVAIGWSFLSSYGTKPPVPDAVVGNLLTELLQTGVKLLIEYFTTQAG